MITRYRLTLTHDRGRVRITTTASSEGAAIALVMRAERCPRRAIVKVETLEVVG